MSLVVPQRLPETGHWTIDPGHSTVTFSVLHHAVSTFRSGFASVQGTYDAKAGSLVGNVRVEDMMLPGLERLKQHILTADFFDAEQHPELSFESRSVHNADGMLAVEGALTMKGAERPLSASGVVRGPVVLQLGDGGISERFGIDLVAVVDRQDFGVSFNQEISKGTLNLGWEVEVEVALELVSVSDLS